MSAMADDIKKKPAHDDLHRYFDTSLTGQSTSPVSSFLGNSTMPMVKKLAMKDNGSCDTVSAQFSGRCDCYGNSQR